MWPDRHQLPTVGGLELQQLEWEKLKLLEWEKLELQQPLEWEKKPLKLKESNWRGESSKKEEEEGEGLKQVERVKWNVWRNFLIAAAASKRKSKLVDSWSSIKSEILVLLKNRKQLLFDQYLANAILHDKTDIRRCRCPDQTGRVRFLGTF